MRTLEELEGKFGKHVEIDGKNATVTFKFQDGPIKEVGENGCQIDELGKLWLAMIKEFNRKFPCIENEHSILEIEEALKWQDARTRDRTERDVEGYSKS